MTRRDEENLVVLVVGLLPYDSGKTTLAKSLVLKAKELGVDVGVSKPITAVNGWYQYESVLRSIELGVLVGNDIYTLHSAASSSDSIEVESAVVSLLMPPDPERVGWQSSAYTAFSLFEQVVCLRVTGIGAEGTETKHFYVPSNIYKLPDTLKNETNRLLDSLQPEAVEATQEQVEDILLNSYKLADDCLRCVTEKHSLVVVESYSNAAAPTQSSLNAKAVIAVAPGKAAIYDGELYRKALMAISDIKEPWLTTTEEVIKLLKPVLTIELKPVSESNSREARETGTDEVDRILSTVFESGAFESGIVH